MTSLPPLLVSLFELTDSGFNNHKSERLLAKGEVAFHTCLEELLLILSTPPPQKPEIIKFETDTVMIAHDHYRLFDGMQTVDTTTADHEDFGYKFSMCQHWHASSFGLFAENVAALSLLYKLRLMVPVSNRVEKISEECHRRAFSS